MAKMDAVVQPFQSKKITRNLPEWTEGAADSNAPVILRVGYVGKTKILHGSYSISGSVYQKRKPTETKGSSGSSFTDSGTFTDGSGTFTDSGTFT